MARAWAAASAAHETRRGRLALPIDRAGPDRGDVNLGGGRLIDVNGAASDRVLSAPSSTETSRATGDERSASCGETDAKVTVEFEIAFADRGLVELNSDDLAWVAVDAFVLTWAPRSCARSDRLPSASIPLPGKTRFSSWSNFEGLLARRPRLRDFFSQRACSAAATCVSRACCSPRESTAGRSACLQADRNYRAQTGRKFSE